MPRYNGGFIGTDGLDAPDEPTIGTPSAGSTQADIAFTAGTAGTTATTEFVATTNDGIGATGTSSPITITGLTNGTSYTARVYAKNSHGTSAASEASASFTPLAEVISGLFSTHLYTGNGSTQSITNNLNLSGKGGLVWLKGRDSTNDHHLFDTERGVTKYLKSSATDAEATDTDTLTAFNSNGFSLGADTDTNADGNKYVSWSFRKTPKFFDVVKYTGTQDGDKTVSHSLNTTVGMVIIRNLTAGNDWYVYHTGRGTSKYFYLNANNAEASGSIVTGTSNTTITLSQSNGFNSSGVEYLAYIFAHNNSDGGFGPDSEDIIKCGSYTGNGSSTGPSINLGFEPQFVMIKSASGSEAWYVYDTMRGMVVGQDDAEIAWNLANSEDGILGTSKAILDPTSTGFNITNTSSTVNTNTHTYIYMAIRRGGMQTPTTASDVFNVSTGVGSDPGYVSGFTVDMAFERNYGSTANTEIASRLTGPKVLKTHATDTESSSNNTTFDYMNGFFAGTKGSSEIAWMWARARGYFDAVAYTGTGSATTVSHNLGVAPEMMWFFPRSNGNIKTVYHSALGEGKRLKLNDTTAAEDDTDSFNNTAPTSSVFSIGTLGQINGSGRTYIAYLFATVANVSKVGSFTQSGATNVACGFTGDTPSFILLKRTDSTGDWITFDSARGIVAGNDKSLDLNNTDAEVTNADVVDPYSGGFATTSSLTDGDYIFYAIAAIS
tara:strand:- start:1505 stop:3664 length:2160 start_codon:yes stop_codon:yes gene_type:complete